MKINNAKRLPLVLYGLHFSPGVAEYQEPGKEPYRILINENVAKKMDPTFVGKPIFVDHVEEVSLDSLQEDADGYVADSFFNQLDGKHWVKMILVSDRAQEAYRNGYQLSNAYVPKSFATGGQWHGVSYLKEVMDGEYEHLALVRDPRYAESMILTPEYYKQYNANKESELKRLSNAKEEKPMKFPIFRRTKVENSKEVDFDTLEVSLPKTKKIVSLTECIEGYDAYQNMSGYAANEHMVKLNDKEECSVADLVKRHNDLEKELAAMKEKNAGGEMGEEADLMSMDNGEGVGEEMGDDDLGVDPKADKTKKNKKLANSEDGGDEDESEDEPVAARSQKNSRSPRHFETLRNADKNVQSEEPPTIMLNADKVARGKSRYGAKA